MVIVFISIGKDSKEGVVVVVILVAIAVAVAVIIVVEGEERRRRKFGFGGSEAQRASGACTSSCTEFSEKEKRAK